MQRVTVCVIGGGVVGTAITLALARRGVDVLLLEAERELALGASGTNSGILHTGFDSPPDALETRLLRHAAELRDQVIDTLRIPILRVDGLLRPHGDPERAAVAELEARAARNGVPVHRQPDGSLQVPGEAVTDPVAFTLALASAAESAGARVTCGARVDSIERREGRLFLSAAGEPIARCRAAVNCAGLFADDVARAADCDHYRIVPRKGEFFVFEPPEHGPLKRILLPVPSAETKGVLVFPTTDGKVIAGPTAVDQKDKRDWSVRPEARQQVVEKATVLMPELEGREPVASYAGLRTDGAGGENYLIGRWRSCPELLHVTAIRSTGLSASLGIAEYALGHLTEMGIKLGAEQPLDHGEPKPLAPWWRRSADYWAGVTS
jgi:glycerol-3-phosphate dehydrogenase